MLKEALDRLHGWFTDSRRTDIVREFNDPMRVCTLKPDGNLHWTPRPQPPRLYKTSTLASLIDASKAYDGWSLWVSEDQVVALIDIEHGPWERITLPLALSPIFETLSDIHQGEFNQKQMIDLLRISFNGADIAPAEFEHAVRSVKFTTSDEQTGDVTPNKADAMGRSIRSQLQAATDLPDSIDVSFDAYPSLDINVPVEVTLAVRVNLTERYFQLFPVPGSLDIAKADAVEAVRKHIAEKLPDAGVFCGVP